MGSCGGVPMEPPTRKVNNSDYLLPFCLFLCYQCGKIPNLVFDNHAGVLAQPSRFPKKINTQILLFYSYHSSIPLVHLPVSDEIYRDRGLWCSCETPNPKSHDMTPLPPLRDSHVYRCFCSKKFTLYLIEFRIKVFFLIYFLFFA
ncbi:hypothetical protein HanIR_Chr11g0520721 [Helianthus annuus]|nr:hypothetical protein HanIR_Chr11g0520721 [Helianthus annuus]